MSPTNLAPFFNTAEFATPVVFDGLPAVAGLYEHDYVRSLGGVGMDNSARAVLLPVADVPANVIGRQVTVEGVSYVVADKTPDDDPGLVALILEMA
ncbi:MAG: hypothetical protein K2X63_11115 [Burkholderiaceae bacterium]|nr:hypothetical protein [Burkholderiaceae bacterium]